MNNQEIKNKYDWVSSCLENGKWINLKAKKHLLFGYVLPYSWETINDPFDSVIRIKFCAIIRKIENQKYKMYMCFEVPIKLQSLSVQYFKTKKEAKKAFKDFIAKYLNDINQNQSEEL